MLFPNLSIPGYNQPFSDARPGQSPGQGTGSLHYPRDGMMSQQDGQLPGMFLQNLSVWLS